MAKDYRVCKGIADFNTGRSLCPVDPGKVKGLIFALEGYTLPEDITPESLEKTFHAARPERLYPVETVEEYAPSGGEAQTGATGYGNTKVTGYSARSDAFTLDHYDLGLKANIIEAKGIPLTVYIVDDDNKVYGVRDAKNLFKGIPLSGVAVGGQDFDSSGAQATLVITIYYKDVEQDWKNADFVEVDFDIVSSLKGVEFVKWLKLDSPANAYKLLEAKGNLDITPYKGKLLQENATTCIPNATGVKYDDKGYLTMTISDSGEPKLAAPDVLQENGVTGIEQI